MKKTILAIACSLFLGQAAIAQNSQEVTYVEDPSQGYLLNSFKDNWFITAEGGVGMWISHGDSKRNFVDRWSPAAGLYVGKWFSPVFGARVGANFLSAKGLSEVAEFSSPFDPMIGNYYKQRFNHVGPALDAMLNLTNWWCGYKPGRVYNAIVYAGVGAYWTFERKFNKDAQGIWQKDGWGINHDRVLAFRSGIINSFSVSPQVAISLDIRFSAIDNHIDQAGEGWNRTAYDLQAYLGVTYNFAKRTWAAPVVPVCPEPENCDALRARLAAADARIADLEAQLRDCLNRPAAVKDVNDAPLATIYYPINVSRLTRQDVNIVNAVGNVMLDNPSKKYVLTGWADNYTGNDQINTRLRKARVDGVARQLSKAGVPASQLDVTTNNGNLCDLGEKFVSLDRAVTIEEAK